jgi:hypothetical protein
MEGKLSVGKKVADLEVSTANQQVNFGVLNPFKVLQSGIDVVEIAMSTPLHSNLQQMMTSRTWNSFQPCDDLPLETRSHRLYSGVLHRWGPDNNHFFVHELEDHMCFSTLTGDRLANFQISSSDDNDKNV